jgi:hypothetical protein
MRDLYREINEAIIGTVEKSVEDGANQAAALRINNNRISKFLKDRAKIEKTIGNPDIPPEGVFRKLVVNGQTDQIKAMRDLLSAEDFAQIKASALNGLIKRNDDYSFSFRNLKNSMRNKQIALEEFLSPEELNEFSKLVRLGDRWGEAVLSSSGTGASNVFRSIKDSLGEAITNEAFVQALKKKARARGKDQADLGKILFQDEMAAPAGAVPPAGPAAAVSEAPAITPEMQAALDNAASMGANAGRFGSIRDAVDAAKATAKGSQVYAVGKLEKDLASIEITDPVVLAEIRKAISEDDTLNTVQKAEFLSNLNKRGAFDMPVPPEPSPPSAMAPEAAGPSVDDLTRAMRDTAR